MKTTSTECDVDDQQVFFNCIQDITIMFVSTVADQGGGGGSMGMCQGPRASQSHSFFRGYTASTVYCSLQGQAGLVVRVLVEPHGVEQLPNCQIV